MEVDDIFNKYEQGIASQEETRRLEEEKAKLRHAVAREAISQCLRSIIEPVLIEAKNKIIARGHSCSVDYQQRVEEVAGERLEYAIGIYLETKGGKFIAAIQNPKLLFTGDVKTHTLTVESNYGSSAVSSKHSDPISLSSVTSNFVALQVREFLAIVFRPPVTG